MVVAEVVAQGDVVWVDFGEPRGSAPALRRPAVVIQHDRFNLAPGNRTVVVLPVTSNLRHAALPGNLRLNAGEGGLSRDSVVLAGRITTVDLGHLDGLVGHLGPERMRQLGRGLALVVGVDG